jgi:hypothetical protein
MYGQNFLPPQPMSQEISAPLHPSQNIAHHFASVHTQRLLTGFQPLTQYQSQPTTKREPQ